MAPPLQDDQIGFTSFSLLASVWTQLPDIPCKEIYIGGLSGNITLGGSVTPGANTVLIPTGTFTMIPTGGNSKNLFVNGSAQTFSFMWRNPRTQLVGWAA